MINFEYEGKEAIFFADPNGRVKQKDKKIAKFNRVGKLCKIWNSVEPKIINDIEKGSREAYAVYFMAITGTRIGNEDSAEGYVANVKGHEGEFVQTFGTSTLRKEHIEFIEGKLVAAFKGKKVVDQFTVVDNEILIQYGKKFYDESETELWLNITDDSVKKYIKDKIGNIFTVKDLRTLCANGKAWHIYTEFLKDKEPLPQKRGDLNKEFKLVAEKTSDFLGNTAGICKSAYISPFLFDFIQQERGKFVLENEQLRIEKKEQKEISWKKQNEDRVAQGLKPLRKKRRDLKSKRIKASRKELIKVLRKILKGNQNNVAI